MSAHRQEATACRDISGGSARRCPWSWRVIYSNDEHDTTNCPVIGLLGSALALTGSVGHRRCHPVTDDDLRAAAEPTDMPSETADPSPTRTPTAVLDGEQEVEIGTYAGPSSPRWSRVRSSVKHPQHPEVPAQWVITPVEGSGETYQLMTVALTDGAATCLALPMEGDVSLATCDAADPGPDVPGRGAQQPGAVSLSATPASSE